MKDFFKEIFEYHHYYNQKLAEQLEANVDRISKRSIPMFSHIVNAHQIWNARILMQATVGVNDIRSLPENKAFDTSNYNTTLQILSEYDLEAMVEYRTFRGDQFSNKLRDLLFHIANHHTHHRAQIISDLRQHGIEPIATDYIFYKRS